jgi:putative acetyltransferase
MVVQIRPARAGETGGIRQMIIAAFGADKGPNIATIVDDLRARGQLRASIVAVDGVDVVGHVALSHSWVDARRALVDVETLSPLSVRPDRQRRGIGTALVEAALESVREAGYPAVFLEGSPDYYEQRGFTRGSSLGFEPASRRTPDVAFLVALTDAHEPWMIGRLIYPDVWWQHDAAGLRDPVLAEVERRFPS